MRFEESWEHTPEGGEAGAEDGDVDLDVGPDCRERVFPARVGRAGDGVEGLEAEDGDDAGNCVRFVSELLGPEARKVRLTSSECEDGHEGVALSFGEFELLQDW